jgi:hypothetical protein
LQNGSVLQKDASGPGTSQKLLSGQYEDSVRNETANAERGARSTSVPQGGVPLQGGTDQSQRDILERIKQQLEDLTRSVEADLQNVSGDPAQTVKTAAAAKPEAPRLDSRSYMSDLPAAGIRSQIDSSGELSLGKPSSHE